MLKFKVQRFPTSPGSFCACVPHGVAYKDASVFVGRCCWIVYEPC